MDLGLIFCSPTGPEHVHDEGVSWNSHGLGNERLQVTDLDQFSVARNGYKGILAVTECMEKFFLQGVHMLFSGGFASDAMCGSDTSSGVWKEGELKQKHAEKLRRDFTGCSAEETLRFKVGDKVHAQVGGWANAVVINAYAVAD